MPKESEYYRDNLARLSERFPGKEGFTLTEVAKWWGVDSQTVKKHLGLQKGQLISAATLARKMANMGA